MKLPVWAVELKAKFQDGKELKPYPRSVGKGCRLNIALKA